MSIYLRDSEVKIHIYFTKLRSRTWDPFAEGEDKRMELQCWLFRPGHRTSADYVSP